MCTKPYCLLTDARSTLTLVSKHWIGDGTFLHTSATAPPIWRASGSTSLACDLVPNAFMNSRTAHGSFKSTINMASARGMLFAVAK